MVKYTIPLPPITKKNHMRIVYNHKTGKPFIRQSAAYEAYEESVVYFLHPRPKKPIDSAVEVKCLFYMPTHRKVDLTNLLSAIDDILVFGGILADDNSKIIVSHDGSRVLYDKENPRTEVYITEVQDEKEE